MNQYVYLKLIFLHLMCTILRILCYIKSMHRGYEENCEKEATRMYDAITVSHYIIDYEDSKGRTVSNLRLQKLLYFIQSTFLAIAGYPCFEEDLEAWDYGPVVPEVYRRYKIFGSTMIPAEEDIDSLDIKSDDRFLINYVLDMCAHQTTRQLVDISHKQDPWKNAYVPGMSNVITKNAILKYAEG